jgi:hypothetical protein
MTPRSLMNAHLNSLPIASSSVLRPLWSLVRVPVLVLLLLLAPVVEFVCGTLLLLGLLVSVAFKISGAASSFPFWPTIALSLGLALFVLLFHALIGMLLR